jgi:hypothetical protein
LPYLDSGLVRSIYSNGDTATTSDGDQLVRVDRLLTSFQEGRGRDVPSASVTHCRSRHHDDHLIHEDVWTHLLLLFLLSNSFDLTSFGPIVIGFVVLSGKYNRSSISPVKFYRGWYWESVDVHRDIQRYGEVWSLDKPAASTDKSCVSVGVWMQLP